MKPELYPLQFYPIFKERIWGGTKLRSELNKDITSEITGESWELSTVENDVSVISNGSHAGKPLTELLSAFPDDILGTAVHAEFGNEFPLLFKFIDAREDLSIQVHPNDELARKRHNSFGKTEMWYIMQADAGARIIVGFKDKSSPEDYVENLKNKTLLDILTQVPAEKGGAFFLETGTIHAIGAGTLLAEIQQTSDITYRVYDWDRVDADGKSRELHVDLALEAMNYDVVDTIKTYGKTPNVSNTVVDCPYFTTNMIPLQGEMRFVRDGRSFTVFMCTDGNFEISVNGMKYNYGTGDTVLVPAGLKSFTITGTASILEIYIS